MKKQGLEGGAQTGLWRGESLTTQVVNMRSKRYLWLQLLQAIRTAQENWKKQWKGALRTKRILQRLFKC